MSLRDVYENGFDEETGKTINATECPECAGDLVTEGGESSCTECGLVVDVHRIDHGPDWGPADHAEQSDRRAGPPLTHTRHERGLSSEIGFGGDATGTPLSGKKRRQIARLRHHHSRARMGSKAERNLATACTEIARMASALDLPRSVREEASLLYRRAQEADLIQGRSIEALAAGSLYAAIRRRGLPRRVEELAAVARCTAQKIKLGFRVLNTELGIQAQPMGITKRVHRLASAVEVPSDVEYRAVKLAEAATALAIANGRNPNGVAGGCLYLAAAESDFELTQAELATLADVSPATIRERYNELLEADA